MLQHVLMEEYDQQLNKRGDLASVRSQKNRFHASRQPTSITHFYFQTIPAHQSQRRYICETFRTEMRPASSVTSDEAGRRSVTYFYVRRVERPTTGSPSRPRSMAQWFEIPAGSHAESGADIDAMSADDQAIIDPNLLKNGALNHDTVHAANGHQPLFSGHHYSNSAPVGSLVRHEPLRVQLAVLLSTCPPASARASLKKTGPFRGSEQQHSGQHPNHHLALPGHNLPLP